MNFFLPYRKKTVLKGRKDKPLRKGKYLQKTYPIKECYLKYTKSSQQWKTPPIVKWSKGSTTTYYKTDINKQVYEKMLHILFIKKVKFKLHIYKNGQRPEHRHQCPWGKKAAQTFIHCWWETKQSLWKSTCKVLKKLNILLPLNPAFILLDYLPKGAESLCLHKICKCLYKLYSKLTKFRNN